MVTHLPGPILDVAMSNRVYNTICILTASVTLLWLMRALKKVYNAIKIRYCMKSGHLIQVRGIGSYLSYLQEASPMHASYIVHTRQVEPPIKVRTLFNPFTVHSAMMRLGAKIRNTGTPAGGNELSTFNFAIKMTSCVPCKVIMLAQFKPEAFKNIVDRGLLRQSRDFANSKVYSDAKWINELIAESENGNAYGYTDTGNVLSRSNCCVTYSTMVDCPVGTHTLQLTARNTFNPIDPHGLGWTSLPDKDKDRSKTKTNAPASPTVKTSANDDSVDFQEVEVVADAESRQLNEPTLVSMETAQNGFVNFGLLVIPVEPTSSTMEQMMGKAPLKSHSGADVEMAGHAGSQSVSLESPRGNDMDSKFFGGKFSSVVNWLKGSSTTSINTVSDSRSASPSVGLSLAHMTNQQLDDDMTDIPSVPSSRAPVREKSNSASSALPAEKGAMLTPFESIHSNKTTSLLPLMLRHPWHDRANNTVTGNLGAVCAASGGGTELHSPTAVAPELKRKRSKSITSDSVSVNQDFGIVNFTAPVSFFTKAWTKKDAPPVFTRPKSAASAAPAAAAAGGARADTASPAAAGDKDENTVKLNATEMIFGVSGDAVYTAVEVFGLAGSDDENKSFFQNTVMSEEATVNAPTNMNPAKKESVGLDDDCVICLSEEKQIFLLPCRHLCVCKGCLVHIDKCPVCRANFEEYIQIDRDLDKMAIMHSPASPGMAASPSTPGLKDSTMPELFRAL